MEKVSWEDIKAQVEQNGGVATMTMGVLRNALGTAKLGVHVRKEISNILAGMGLGHVPVELPAYQHEQVRLFKQGTPVGAFIQRVLAPGEQNDRALITKFSSSTEDHALIIEKIRELVSE